jgi:hypothetical protein
VACDPLVINAPPEAATTTNPVSSPPKAQFDNHSYAASKYFFYNAKPAFSHNITAISNNSLAKCDSIRNEIKGPNINETAGYALAFQNDEPIPVAARSMTATSAFSAVLVKTAVTARVIAKCRGNYDTLAIVTDTVVPNPTLTGNCAWSVNPATVGESTQPQGISIVNELGRCGAGVTYSGGPYPLTITKEIIMDPANSNGITVNASANCGTYGSLSQTCQQALKFSYTDIGEGDNVGNCKYEWNWCNNWPLEIVKTDFVRTHTMNNACVFVTGISKLATATYKINGQSFSATLNSAVNLSSIEKADGGYYVWVPKADIDNSDAKWTVTPGKPDCTPGIPTNAVSICKSHCADLADGAFSKPVLKSGAAENKKEYVVMVYGNENCSNLRHDGPSTRCEFKVDGVTVNAHNNENVTSINNGSSKIIEYLGTSANCPASVKFKCN